MLRYRNTHHIILGGDFNASLYAEIPDATDRTFNNFVNLNCLNISKGHPPIPTYTKPDGAECSSLDYVLTDQNTGA